MTERAAPTAPSDAAVIAVDGGDLALGEGLLALVRPALARLEPGGVLAVLSDSRAAREDLPSWCRLERHEYLGAEALPSGRARHLIRRGVDGVARLPPGVRPATRLDPAAGPVRAVDALVASPLPERAEAFTGFAPRGARVEPGGPAWPFDLLDRDRVAPPEVAQLYDQAVASQWDAARDIPWARVPALPDALESAVAQAMSFLAENELSALYVPSRFLARIHPAYVETAMFLATQLNDEARHIDAFLKRARLRGHGAHDAPVSSATTAHSLRTLLDPEDFTEATFLLSVLGEGTFLDLLRFIETHAPDEATAEVCRRARADEARHVHFGMAHIRHTLARDPGLYPRLAALVRARAAAIPGQTVPAAVQDALTVLAARGTDAASLRRGSEAFRELLASMHEARVKRLINAGFSTEQADELSGLHTANFM